MDLFPIFLDVRDRLCLVIGGGEVATRKASLLREAGARVTVVAPDVSETLRAMEGRGEVTVRRGRFEASDLEGAHLVIAATADPEVNRLAAGMARELRVPVNVVDQPELGSFVVPSIIDRSPVLAAVTTGGAAPVLARLIRARLETLIPASYGRLAALASAFRDRVKAHFPHPPDRRKFWEKVLQGPVAELVFSGREAAAEAALASLLESAAAPAAPGTGEVYLVGGGPGDPDLLTFRALRLMQQADVVVHDRLVAREVLELCRRDAERIYVGKERDNHTMPQEDINRLLARLAREGKRVLRLKGGDPFIFGRGGEEIETLAEEGIPFQVVPGITAASGCASYAGIPLTHRDYAQACVFVTGHTKEGTVDLNWSALVQPRQTVVFYMGLRGLDMIVWELRQHGMPPEMPAALIEQGTTPRQRVHTGTLATLPEIVREQTPRPPTLLIVGEVVRLRAKLAWFESAPRAGHARVEAALAHPPGD
jgi:uroporphyrin-III C-methyltransferase/precorrin-2 dehydrogenase/sirohydrochlorin ferrochelatase